MSITYGAIGTYNSGTGTPARTPGIPAGVVEGSCVLAFIGANAATNVTSQTGFTLFAEVANSNASMALFWKRASSAESGTYSLAHNAISTNASQAVAVRVEGELNATTPIGGTTTGSQLGVTSIPASALSDTTKGGILFHVVNSQIARTYTPPSGFTRLTVSASQRMHVSAWLNVSGGNVTGVTGSMGASGFTEWCLFEVLPEAGSLNISGVTKDRTELYSAVSGVRKPVSVSMAVSGAEKRLS